MIYLFNENGKDVEIQPERWGWGVVYKDDTELKQFGDDGRFHQFQEINQDEVKLFVMYRLDNPDRRIDLPIVDGMQIFHFYRNYIFNATQEDERKVRVYVFGYKEKADAKCPHCQVSASGACNKMAYHYILPDDRMVVAKEDIKGLPEYQI